MSNLTVDDLLRFAASLEGELLSTMHEQKEFTIRVLSSSKIEITPTSSEKSRTANRTDIERVCQEYNGRLGTVRA